MLDGGLRQWQLEQRPITTEAPVIEPTVFTAGARPGWMASKEDVVAALGQPDTLLIDCLTPELYRGRGDRHLWGQRPCHIPGAVNVPYLANIDPRLATATAAEREQLLAGGRPFTFSSTEVLAGLYRAAGVRADRSVIT